MSAADATANSGKLKANKAKAIVDAAYAGGYAVVAVCCYNLEGIMATVRAYVQGKYTVVAQGDDLKFRRSQSRTNVLSTTCPTPSTMSSSSASSATAAWKTLFCEA